MYSDNGEECGYVPASFLSPIGDRGVTSPVETREILGFIGSLRPHALNLEYESQTDTHSESDTIKTQNKSETQIDSDTIKTQNKSETQTDSDTIKTQNKSETQIDSDTIETWNESDTVNTQNESANAVTSSPTILDSQTFEIEVPVSVFMHIATEEYQSSERNQLSFPKGAILSVIEKCEDGRYKISIATFHLIRYSQFIVIKFVVIIMINFIINCFYATMKQNKLVLLYFYTLF